MAGKKKVAVWRAEFLKTLSRTGNVRVSAAAAGVHFERTYALRNSDEGFKEAWAKALAYGRERVAAGKGAAQSGTMKTLPGTELCVRVSKRCGTQLVRAAPGRWTKEAEEGFFAELVRTSNVTGSARKVGFSATAVYQRRMRKPEFAAKWAEALAQASVELDMALAHAAKVALGAVEEERGGAESGGAEGGGGDDAGGGNDAGGGAGDGAGALRLTPRELIQIANMLRPGDAARAGAGGLRQRGPRMRAPVPIEKVRDDVVRRLEAIRRHRAREAESEAAAQAGGEEGGGGAEA